MRSTHIEKSFCTTKEAATLLGVSVGTVQIWVESGLLEAWKTAGGHRRVMRDSVERLLHKKSSAVSGASLSVVPMPPPERRMEVLVVEDDPSLLRLYEVRIAAWPMAPRVQVTPNAFGALLSIGRSCPDLLITDLHMPGIDGFVMLKALQRAPEAQTLQTVVVTGLDSAQIAARGGLPAGIPVLGKPVPFDRLLDIANERLRSQQLLAAS